MSTTLREPRPTVFPRREFFSPIKINQQMGLTDGQEWGDVQTRLEVLFSRVKPFHGVVFQNARAHSRG